MNPANTYNVQPTVYLIGETMPSKHQISRYLRDAGYDSKTVAHWDNLPAPTLNDLIEFMGRLCYASFDLSQNDNLTRVRNKQEAYIENLLDSGHGSVLEHAEVNFVIRNCSRVLTHELVRHRVGTAISQESMRYVRTDAWNFVYPRSFLDESIPIHVQRELVALSEQLLANTKETLAKMTDLLQMETFTFNEKKRYTSALRRWIPNGVATQIGWSANIRTLRHVINLRSSDAAEEEMRTVADRIARLCFDRYPLLFKDFTYESPEFHGDAPVWKGKFLA